MCKRELERRNVILLGLIFCFLVQASSFADEQSEPIETSAVQTNAVKKELRDPFWPVGYQSEQKKAAEEAAAETVEEKVDEEKVESELNWDEAMKLIQINGVSSKADNEFLAVINGKVKTEGERITVQMNGKTYSWTIDKITPPGSVKLRRATVE